MNRVRKFALTAAVAGLMVTGAAVAGPKLMKKGASVAVAKSLLMVTPTMDWNRIGARPGRNAESWTLDGLSLNDVTFYGGIANDTTLFRDAKKKTEPLPHFTSSMLAPDVAQLFESSYRVSVGTSLMSIDSIEPATFAGKDGFRFQYSFTVKGEEIRRKGEATGAIIGGKLYLVSYEAPVIHYYNRDLENYRALVGSARFGAGNKRR